MTVHSEKVTFAPWPSFSNAEIDAVEKVLRSGKVNYWTGQESREFEKEFADFCGSTHAIAVANGTVALDLALMGLGIGARNGGLETDEVVVSPRTFLASASSIVNAGAVPVFADVDRDSQNITPETVAPVLTKQTRAILCVHLAGWPCEMDGFSALIAGQKIKLIEDCAQAHGALYKGRPVGSLGDVAAWSFCQDKIMTTGGEGGMVTVNDAATWNRMWSFKDHGKNYDAVYGRDHPPGFRWLHESFGTNWRITEMQSAIGRIQLDLMADWTKARNGNAARLTEALAQFDSIRVPQTAAGNKHAFYKFYAQVRPECLSRGWTRDRIVAEINALGVPCMQGSCSEVYREKAFDNTHWRPQSRLSVAQELGDTSLMFLVHPTLTKKNIDAAVSAIAIVLRQAEGMKQGRQSSRK
ncbi:MAG: DegT/DnrJ/EryC1/StrS aminotransferase family protein [Rhizobiaceae bacterium]